MRRCWWFLTLVVVVAACSGDDSAQGVSSPEPSSAGIVIESSGGLAALALPEGALPEGISPDNLQLHAVAIEGAEEGLPMMRVQLLPHGLRLNEPASLTIELPADARGGFIAIHQSGRSVEFLDGDVLVEGGVPRFATEISHFSDAYLIRDVFDTKGGNEDESKSVSIDEGVATGSMVLTPNPVSPGQLQEAHVDVAVSETVSILLPGDDDVVRLYEFELERSHSFESTTDWSLDSETSADWDPPRLTPEPTDTADGWETVASSKCLQPNTTQVFSETTVHLNVTVLDITAVSDPGFEQAAEMFGGLDDGFSVGFVTDDLDPMHVSPNIEELQIGHQLDVTSWAISSSEAICTEVSSTQIPPGLDPRAHIVSVTPYVTEDGTHGFIVGFSQPWDGLPVLYSFFVELVATAGECSMTAGHETHAGSEEKLGSGAKYLLDDGTFAFETDCPYDPDNVFEIIGRSGSQAESTSSAVFDTFVEPDVPTSEAASMNPSRVTVVIDPGLPEHLKAARPIGASNDGDKITVTFAGNMKAMVDGGVYKVRINAQATDGGIRVTVTLRSTDGDLLLNGATFDDADEVDGSIDGKNVETTWVWPSGGNEVVIGLSSPDGVDIPASAPTISVTVQETESSPEIAFNYQ